MTLTPSGELGVAAPLTRVSVVESRTRVAVSRTSPPSPRTEAVMVSTPDGTPDWPPSPRVTDPFAPVRSKYE